MIPGHQWEIAHGIAARAVCALRLGGTVDEVRLELAQNDSTDARVVAGDQAPTKVATTPEARSTIVLRLVVASVAPIAEARAGADSDTAVARYTQEAHAETRRLASLLRPAMSEADIDEAVAVAKTEAHNRVNRLWPAIKAVAEELIGRGVVSGERVREIADQALRRRGKIDYLAGNDNGA